MATFSRNLIDDPVDTQPILETFGLGQTTSSRGVSSSTSTLASTPALTTIWTSPDSCSTHWTYYQVTGTFYTYLYQDAITTQDTPCLAPQWAVNSGTFSPGVCPYLWTTWSSTTLSGSITSVQCCPSGYINFFSDCASLYSTTRTSVVIFTSYSQDPITADVSAGTAVVSGVHILYQSSDLSILPTPASISGSQSSASRTGGSTSGAPVTNSPQPTNTSASGGGGLSKGAIAGISIAVIAAVLLFIAGSWYVWRLRRQLSGMKKGSGGNDGVGELHGEDVKRHELLAVEKPSEAFGSDPAVEMPVADQQKKGGLVSHLSPAEMQG